MRWVALALTVIVVVLAVVVASQREEHPRTTARAPEPQPPAKAAPAPLPPEAVPEEPKPGPLTVRIAVGWLGSERPVQRVKGRVRAGDYEIEAIPVATDDGAFEVTLPGPGWYHLDVFEIDGEEFPLAATAFLVRTADPIEIRVPRAREVTLVVVDARDRRPLADVLVYDDVDSSDWNLLFEPGHIVPGPKTRAGQPRRTDRSARLPMGRGWGAARLYLFAPGYAWKAVSVPFDAGGEVVVELERAGALRLVVAGWRELREPRVWAHRVMSSDDFRVLQPDDNGELLIDGLLADDYVFTVRRGRPWDEGKVYGTGEVRVRAGETAELKIHAKPDAPLSKVHVTGTLTVPATWKEPPSWMIIEGFGEATAEVHEVVIFSDPPYTFRTKAIPPGKYSVKVQPHNWIRWVTVSYPRGGHFDFELPHPVTVRVAVVDGAERHIPGARVLWLATIPGRSSGGLKAARKEPSDRFVFQVAPATVVLQVSAPGHVYHWETLEVDEDRDVTVRMRKGGIVVVRLRLDGRPFDGADVRVELDTGHGCGIENGVARFEALEPGDYDVKLDDVAGCAAVPPQRVKVEAGRTHEVLFDLNRKPVPEVAER
jgi:hypothetical protein